MLEEALSSPTYPPSEAALALSSFLRSELPAGGSIAEARFLRLFPALCARVFGELDPNDGFRYGVGGWLGRREAWARSPSAGGRGGGGSREGETVRRAARRSSLRGSYSGGGRSSSSRGARGGKNAGGGLGMENDPVVRLLSAGGGGSSSSGYNRDRRRGSGPGRSRYPSSPTLVDAISDETEYRPNVQFSFPLQALPLPTQEALLALTDPALLSASSAAAGSDPAVRASDVTRRGNALRLLGAVLRVTATEQNELRYALQARFRAAQQQAGVGVVSGGGAENRTLWGGGVRGLGSPAAGPWRVAGASTSSPMALDRSPLSPLPEGAMALPLLPLPKYVPAGVQLSMLEFFLVHFVRFPAAGQSSNPLLKTAALEGPSQGQGQQGQGSPSPGTPQPQGHPHSQFQTPPSGGNYAGINSYTPHMAPSAYQRSQSHHGSQQHHGESTYLYLFQTYLCRYLPHNYSSLEGGGGLSGHSPVDQPSVVPLDGLAGMDGLYLPRDSELFLRLLIELWLEGENVPQSGMVRGGARAGVGVEAGAGAEAAEDGGPDLDAAADAASASYSGGRLMRCPYRPPSPLVLRCVRSLIVSVVSDPALREAVAGSGRGGRDGSGSSLLHRGDVGNSGTESGGSAVPPNSFSDGDTVAASAARSPPPRLSWCLTPAMTVLQAPIYNYIRMSLRHGMVHVPDSSFYGALKAWLVWIEPWNVVLRRSRSSSGHLTHILDTVTTTVNSVKHRGDKTATSGGSASKACVMIPKPTSASRYNASWEPFLAANLYLYAIPFAIFLRRAREMDFSSSHDFQRSLTYVQRVLRVFSPEVVAVLDRLLSTGREDPSASNTVARHERVLGDYCPLRPLSGAGFSLSSLQRDMHNLLEEMFLEHQKRVREQDVFDRIAARLDVFGGQSVKADGAALTKLVERARVVVKFPENYEVLPGTKSRGGYGGEGAMGAAGVSWYDNSPDRFCAGGFLTDRGREQILSGSRKCSAFDVHYVGDPMYTKPRTYEVAILVKLTIWVSDWLNRNLGLVSVHDETEGVESTEELDENTALMLKHYREGEEYRKAWFRINLRFLADYRNLLFAALFVVVTKPFR